MARPTEEVDFGGVGDPLNPSEAAMRLSDFSSTEQQPQRTAAGSGEPGAVGGGLGGSELPFAQPPSPAPAPMGSAAPVQLAPAPVTSVPASAPSPAVTAAASMGASVSSAAGSLFERIRAAQAQAQTGGSPSRAAPLMGGSEQPTVSVGGEEGGVSSAMGASSQFFSAISGRSSSLLSGSTSGGDDGNNAAAGAVASDPSAGYDTGTFYASRTDLEPAPHQQLQQQPPVDAAGAPPTVPGSGGLRVPSYAPVPNTETAHAPYSAGDSTSDRAKMALSSAWDAASKLGSKAARAGTRAAGSIMDKARGGDGNSGGRGNSSLLSEGNGMHGGDGGGAEMMESGTNLGGSGAAFGAQFSGAASASNVGGAVAAAGAPEGTSTAMGGIGSHSGYGPVSGQEGGGGQGQEEYNMWTYFRTFIGDLCGLVEQAPLWVQSVLLLLFIYFLWSVLK